MEMRRSSGVLEVSLSEYSSTIRDNEIGSLQTKHVARILLAGFCLASMVVT
jgi:hypothetical protein